jgi:hypothetical protein
MPMMLRQQGTNTPFSVASWFLWCGAAPAGATAESSAWEEASEVAEEKSSGLVMLEVDDGMLTSDYYPR